jgi:precorrin-2 dehydrogenase/sirohydrochlorin ferrochelatase
MKYYPIFVRAAGRKCLVVGGGTVAEQKVRSLLDAGADVTVVSPDLTPKLERMVNRGDIRCIRRLYDSGDASGYFIVFAATGGDLDRRIVDDAAQSGALLNVVDQPELCDFISPGVVARDDLTIAISTSGASPAMARQLRQKLEAEIGPEYALALQLLGRLRQRLKDKDIGASERSRIFNELVESPLLELLRRRRFAEVDALLGHATGARFTLSSLEINWSDEP